MSYRQPHKNLQSILTVAINNLISLLYNKSDKHLTLYVNYNAEYAARMTKSVELSNIIDVYSTTNLPKCDINSDRQKHLLWKQYVVWNCNDCTTPPISNYINSPVFQELLPEKNYFENKSDKKLYIDLGDSMRVKNHIEMTQNQR